MTPAQFRQQVHRAWKALEEVGVGESQNTPRYPDSLPSEMRSKTYREGWNWLRRNLHFDIQLSDASLILFKHRVEEDGEVLSGYSHYPPPTNVPSYDEFLTTIMDTNFESAGDSLRQEYEQHVNEADNRQAVTPIRYDYSPKLYTCGRHPASHFHIGISNEIRIGTERILGPIGFALFILRQCYPEQWLKYISRQGRAQFATKHMRDDLEAVAAKYRQEHDLSELVLRLHERPRRESRPRTAAAVAPRGSPQKRR
jgi:hypothetical protein